MENKEKKCYLYFIDGGDEATRYFVLSEKLYDNQNTSGWTVLDNPLNGDSNKFESYAHYDLLSDMIVEAEALGYTVDKQVNLMICY